MATSEDFLLFSTAVSVVSWFRVSTTSTSQLSVVTNPNCAVDVVLEKVNDLRWKGSEKLVRPAFLFAFSEKIIRKTICALFLYIKQNQPNFILHHAIPS